MMTRPLLAAALAATLALPAAAEVLRASDHRAGDFDYYVLSLSWSPSWCATDGKGRNARQCETGRRTGFVVHGLWPQYEQGWPDYCATDERDPSRRESQAMEDVMGSGGLAWYQWQKHGRCSGLSARGYYQAIRQSAASVTVPPVLRMLPREVRLEASVIKQAFIETNPDLTADGITVTCNGGRVDEVRICLTRDLAPRDCAPDSRQDCRGKMLMEPPR